MANGEQSLVAISKAEASRRAAQALSRAREHCGFETRAEFARWLAREEQLGSDAPDESSYNRWEEGTVRVPGWFLIAVAEVVALRLDQLLGMEPLEPLPPGTLERLERLEAAVERLTLGMDELLERRLRGRSHTSQAGSGG